jgi:hypothetical protein
MACREFKRAGAAPQIQKCARARRFGFGNQPASQCRRVEGGREDAVDIDGMQNTPITESAIGLNPAQKCVEGAVISVVGGVGLTSFLGRRKTSFGVI